MRQLFAAAAILCAACANPGPLVPAGAGSGTTEAKPDRSNLQVVLVSDVDGDGVISYGDFISYTFDAKDWHQLSTACYQDGQLVASALQSTWHFAPIELRSRMYTGGAAECVGELQRLQGGNEHTVALGVTRFAVAE